MMYIDEDYNDGNDANDDNDDSDMGEMDVNVCNYE